MTERIRWEPIARGGFTGYVGTLQPCVFEVWQSWSDYEDVVIGEWVLSIRLPAPFSERLPHGHDPEALKAEAEKWLERFVCSLGAVFPAEAAADLRARADEMEAMVAHDTGHERDKQLFNAGLRRAADLLEHGDQPAANPEGADR